MASMQRLTSCGSKTNAIRIPNLAVSKTNKFLLLS